ncbi:response regulator [Iningainema tapete]|uniref:Response regulator n=1 Tax=Iningainema tapete BLCC-T55 TaxID=2748662 RepID=A0A8J6XFY4_9CYAN|nr:response regulator [Iningainema tapete]MBD2776015.1 response regulator [Iningainema tapete BLCC-T55]
MPKILLVEDNEINRDILSHNLQGKNFEVILAINGEQGVAMAHSEAPDLILMDMGLPVLNGWEATKLIKQSSDTESIPVIALTAYAMAGDREKALESGCDEYETKPIDLTQLLQKIQLLLARQTQGQ